MRKFGFILSFLFPFFLFSANTCPQCKPLVDLLTEQVNNAYGWLMSANGQISSAWGYAETALWDVKQSHYADEFPTVDNALNSGSLQHSNYQQSFQQCRDTLIRSQQILESFDCNCSSNNCACLPALISISNDVGFIYSIVDSQYNFLSNRLTKIDDFMYDDISKLVDDYEVTWSSSFTNNVFSWGLLSKWLFRDNDKDSAWRQFQQQFDESLAHHPETGLSNEGFVGLRQLDTLQKMMYINAGIAEMLANKPNSTTNETDLSSITNYLYKIQKPFYENYNAMFRSHNVPNPYNPNLYHYVTNFFQHPDYESYRRIIYPSFQQRIGYSNFFSRVELYLMALNGLFSDSQIVPDDEFASIYSESKIDHDLGSATNQLSGFETDSATLTNYLSTSWTEGIAAIFDKINDTTVFEGSTGDGRYITFIPSFNLGGIQIEHLDFDIETIRPVIDFSHAAFRCIWAGIYLVVFFVFVWFVGARVFRVMLWLVQFISGSLGN